MSTLTLQGIWQIKPKQFLFKLEIPHRPVFPIPVQSGFLFLCPHNLDKIQPINVNFNQFYFFQNSETWSQNPYFSDINRRY